MSAPQRDDRRQRLLVWTACLLGGLVGLKYGYDFGELLSGTALGVITGINLAVVGAFVAGSAVSRLLRWNRSDED
jgi:hypothetical protein